MLRTKDLITKLLDGLEVFLGVCGMSSNSSNLQIVGGTYIYIGHTLELAVRSRWALFCVGIGTSSARASVLPVTLRSELAVGFSDIVAATPGTIG